MELTIFEQHDISENFRRIEDIIKTGLFTPEHLNTNPFLSAAMTEILVCLNDLLQKSNKLGFRISFKDDIHLSNEIKDITDLINKIRNVRCHIGSKSQIINQIDKIGMVIIPGKQSIIIGEIEMKSDYDNDVRFYFGEYSLYLNRHIFRAYQEAKHSLNSYALKQYPELKFSIT